MNKEDSKKNNIKSTSVFVLCGFLIINLVMQVGSCTIKKTSNKSFNNDQNIIDSLQHRVDSLQQIVDSVDNTETLWNLSMCQYNEALLQTNLDKKK